MLRILIAFGLLCFTGIYSVALADDAVDARLHIVIPAGPGGGLDATARAIGRALVSDQEVARVSYENRTGGGGGKAMAYFCGIYRLVDRYPVGQLNSVTDPFTPRSIPALLS